MFTRLRIAQGKEKVTYSALRCVGVNGRVEPGLVQPLLA